MARDRSYYKCMLILSSFIIFSLNVCFTTFLLLSTSEAAEPRYGGIFRTNISEPRSLSPTVEVAGNVYMITGNTYNGLLRWNKDMSNVELDLAESWKRTDALTYIFKIHQGVLFHDIAPVNGREITTKDIKYTIERAMGIYGQKWKFIHRYYFEDRIDSIETPDKYTIVFKTKEPYAPFIPYLASARSVILPREIADKHGDFKRYAIGTGPFILKEYIRGSHAILIRNPNYFKKGLPYLNEINLKIISDPASVMAAFLSNKLDSFGPYFFQLKLLKEKVPDSIIIKRPGTHQWILRVRPWSEKHPLNPPFSKLKVRQAMAMAIDKKRLLKLAWGGAGTVQVGPVPNWPPYSLTEEDQVEYNPEKAKKLLVEAGYPNGFTTELTTWNARYMTKPAQVIQAMLKEVGINVNLKFMEMAQYFGLGKTFGYDMSLHVTTAGVDPDEWITPYFGPPDRAQYYRWINPEVWKMCLEQSKILDKEKRATLIREIHRKVISDARWICLYTQKRYTAMRPYVHRNFYKNGYQPLIGETFWMEKH